MGFFDWFKKKPKNEVSEEEIRINELNKRLDQLRDTKFSGVYKEFEGYNSKIKKIFESITKGIISKSTSFHVFLKYLYVFPNLIQ